MRHRSPCVRAIAFAACTLALTGLPALPAFGAQDETLAELRKHVETLETRLKELEASGQMATTATVNEDLAEIFERLNRAERKAFTDKIDFGLSFRTRWDNFKFTDQTGAKNETEHAYNVWSNRFSFRMAAKPSDTLQFHGRLTVYKRWADIDNTDERFWDASFSEVPSDNTLRLDRAYVDLFFRDLWLPVAVTVGRQPTVGGPPEHVKDNTEVRSTFPALAFEREVEGVILTLGLSRFTGLDQSALRVMYGKFLQPDNDKMIWKDDQGGDVHLLWLQAETNLAGNWSGTKAMATYVRNWNYPGAPFENVTTQPGDLGYSETYAGTVVAEEFYGSAFTWFASAAYSKTYGSGSTVKMDRNGDGVPETYGLLSADGRADREGYSVYLGARYTIPCGFLKHPSLGLEYNHGSRYWWTIHAGTEDPIGKLATRGNAWEAYYAQEVMPGAALRFGLVYIDYAYKTEKPPLGKPAQVEQQYWNPYLVLDIHF